MFKLKSWIILALVLGLVAGFMVGCETEEDPEEVVDEDVNDEDVDEEEYPTQNIEWVISREPGDGQDIIARGIAQYLDEELGVNVVVDNTPGAGGRVGFGELHRAEPDGYYIGQDVLGTMANFHIFGDLDDPLMDVEWFAGIYSSPAAVWVDADSDMETLEDLQALDRPVIIGDTSMAGTHIPWTIALMQELGVEYEYATGFEGRPELATAAMRGEIDFVSSSVGGYADLIGDIKPLVVMDEERHELLPDTPTILEQGEDMGMEEEFERIMPMGLVTYMVGAPPETPREKTRVLEEAMQSVIEENEDFQEWADNAEMDAVFRGYDEINQMLDDVIFMLEEIDIVEIVEGE